MKGIFFGAFNPIHEGHILFAQMAKQQFNLEDIVYILKTGKDENSRKEILNLCIDGQVCDRSFKSLRQAVTELKEELGPTAILIGAEDFSEIDEDTLKILGASNNFIIALVGEDSGELAVPLAKKLGINAEYIPAAVSSPTSTKIRKAIKENKQPIGLNDEVLEYIKSKKLYE